MKKIIFVVASWLALITGAFAQSSYNPLDWYWSVQNASPGSQVWASKRGQYVALADSGYVAFLAAGNSPSVIATDTALLTVIYDFSLTVVRPAYVAVGGGGTVALTAPLARQISVTSATQVNLPQANLPISTMIGPVLITNSTGGDLLVDLFDGTTNVATIHDGETETIYPKPSTLLDTNGTIGAEGVIARTNSYTDHISFQPGLMSGAIVGTKGGFTKFGAKSTVRSMTASATTFTCSVNAQVTMYNCGGDPTCMSGVSTVGIANIASAGAGFAASLSITSIAKGDYIAWAVSGGTCTALDISATAETTQN